MALYQLEGMTDAQPVYRYLLDLPEVRVASTLILARYAPKPSYYREYFPEALRVADRFHVHGYVVEAVQTVRKNIQGTLPSRANSMLKIINAFKLLTEPSIFPDRSPFWGWRSGAVTGVIFYLPLTPQLQDKMSFSKFFLGIFPHVTIELFGFFVILAACLF